MSSKGFSIEDNLYLRLENLKYKMEYDNVEEVIRKSFTFMFLLAEIEESECELYFRDAEGKEHPISFYTDLSGNSAEDTEVEEGEKAPAPAVKTAAKNTSKNSTNARKSNKKKRK